ncbi:MAG TPA: LPS export ABC transporter periplasmic protein LptC [Chitinophagaceae bacterium]|nr:LPS export ABC transporter periplasmic protein LptC [Chitinophagaceae bacterium]
MNKIISYQQPHFKIARNLLSGILFCSLLVHASCHNTTEEINNITGVNKAYQLDKATDVVIYYSDKAKVKAVLYAKEFIRNENAKPAYTDIKKSLKVEFLDDSGHIESTLTSRSARIYEDNNNVIVRENVHVVNQKGEQLDTEELVWNQKLDKFYTNKKIKITTPPNQVLYGDGLEANADFSWYKSNNLKGEIAVEGKELPQ